MKKTRFVFSYEKCDVCGERLYIHVLNFHKYGSPLRTCPHCGTPYVDRYYREIVIENDTQIELGKTIPLFLILTGGLFLYRSTGYWRAGMMAGYMMIPVILNMALGILILSGGVWEMIRILSGRKFRKFYRYFEESKERLSHPSYALKLSRLGYAVPEKYMNNIPLPEDQKSLQPASAVPANRLVGATYTEEESPAGTSGRKKKEDIKLGISIIFMSILFLAFFVISPIRDLRNTKDVLVVDIQYAQKAAKVSRMTMGLIPTGTRHFYIGIEKGTHEPCLIQGSKNWMAQNFDEEGKALAPGGCRIQALPVWNNSLEKSDRNSSFMVALAPELHASVMPYVEEDSIEDFMRNQEDYLESQYKRKAWIKMLSFGLWVVVITARVAYLIRRNGGNR